MLPRRVYTYWHQGLDSAPPIVRACTARLEPNNDGWQVETHDAESAKDIIDSIPISSEKLSSLSHAHLSDLIRTKLLIDRGGVWVDPTVFVTRPLESWLPSKMAAGIFLFSHPGRDRLISNWFIAAEAGHPILVSLYESLCSYWQDNNFRRGESQSTRIGRMLARAINRNLTLPLLWFSWPVRKLFKQYPYMVYHYMFCRLVRNDTHLKEIFSAMPIVSADKPHALQRIGLGAPFGPDAECVLRDRDIPLHKLNWKVTSGGESAETVLDHLIQSVKTA